MKTDLNIRRRLILCIIYVLCMTFSLIACSENTESTEKTPRDVIEKTMWAQATTHYEFNYSIKMVLSVNVTSIQEIGENEYKAYGKVQMADNYGDVWEAKFEGECTVNGDKGSASNMEYGEPYKK